jgi:manganese/iron transport system substrate-binding protein
MKLLALLAAFVFTACAGTAPRTDSVSVVTTTTVLADFVRQVGGDRVAVHALVPRGADPHTFDPSPSDAVRVSEADLLVMNGLGLDEWLGDFITQAGAADVPLVELAEDLPGVEYLEGDEHHDDEDNQHDEDEDDHAYNPHVWMDVGYARLYIDRLADELVAADPDGSAVYRANAQAYDAQLAELDGWIRDQVAQVPSEERRVVSFHAAFPYFAQAYGLEIVGVLVEVPGREPSAAEVGELIEAIRESGVRVILAEAQFSDQLARTLASETDAVVVSNLYTDSLGDAPADTFVGAMRWNVEQIVQALE